VDSDVSDEQLKKQYLGKEVKIPDLATVKDFFCFHAALCKPRILNMSFTDCHGPERYMGITSNN
jgi:hypothetical protein